MFTRLVLMLTFSVPIALTMLGVMFGALEPRVGITMFELAIRATMFIAGNLLAYWYITVPVGAIMVWAESAES